MSDLAIRFVDPLFPSCPHREEVPAAGRLMVPLPLPFVKENWAVGNRQSAVGCGTCRTCLTRRTGPTAPTASSRRHTIAKSALDTADRPYYNVGNYDRRALPTFSRL